MAIFYDFDKNIRVNIGVGDAGAFTIVLYYYNERNLIVAASLVTAPWKFRMSIKCTMTQTIV